jgi:hypothetical protein
MRANVFESYDINFDKKYDWPIFFTNLLVTLVLQRIAGPVEAFNLEPKWRSNKGEKKYPLQPKNCNFGYRR